MLPVLDNTCPVSKSVSEAVPIARDQDGVIRDQFQYHVPRMDIISYQQL